MQSIRRSAMESFANTFAGLIINWLIMVVCLSLIRDKYIAATVTTILCTVHSLCRGFAFRRYFARND